MIAVRSAWKLVFRKYREDIGGEEWKEEKKRNEGVGRDGRRRWSVGEEIDESGEMEHEIVKPLRENVAENGLFGLGMEGSLVSGLNGENRGTRGEYHRLSDKRRARAPLLSSSSFSRPSIVKCRDNPETDSTRSSAAASFSSSPFLYRFLLSGMPRIPRPSNSSRRNRDTVFVHHPLLVRSDNGGGSVPYRMYRRV